MAARDNEPPLDSGGPGCPVSAVGGPGSVRTDAAADGVATVGNDAVLSCYGPTGSRVGSLVSGDSATPCCGRANGGQALASVEAEATVGRVGCGESQATNGGDGEVRAAGASPRGWIGGSGVAMGSATAMAARDEIGCANLGCAHHLTRSTGLVGSETVPMEPSTKGGGHLSCQNYV